MVQPIPPNLHTTLTPPASPFPNDPMRRAKQVLGKTGDLWALIDLIRDPHKLAALQDEVRDSIAALTALIREYREAEAGLTERLKAHDAVLIRESREADQQRKQHDAATLALTKRTNDLNFLEEVIKSTETALSQRENALAARETRLAKETQAIDTRASYDALAITTRNDALSRDEKAHADRVAAFERRFAAAKAILAAVPDEAAPATTHAAPAKATNPH